MIFGIGTDICDVRRIQRSTEKLGVRFASKILTQAELAIWQERTSQSSERGSRYLASRFAAKEAVSKALGLGMQTPMTWHNCQILNSAAGAPVLHVLGSLQIWCAERQLAFHVSLSDEADYAVAFCVAEVRTAPVPTLGVL